VTGPLDFSAFSLFAVICAWVAISRHLPSLVVAGPVKKIGPFWAGFIAG
jgi:hypothetical protein